MSDPPVPAERVMAIRKATGLPVLEARAFIQKAPPELVERVLEGDRMRYECWRRSVPAELTDKIGCAAHQRSNCAYLRDPAEDDPETGPVIREILDQVTEELKPEEGWQMGLCHLIWRTAKERLLREHSIVWYTPSEMNPGSIFD